MGAAMLQVVQPTVADPYRQRWLVQKDFSKWTGEKEKISMTTMVLT